LSLNQRYYFRSSKSIHHSGVSRSFWQQCRWSSGWCHFSYCRKLFAQW